MNVNIEKLIKIENDFKSLSKNLNLILEELKIEISKTNATLNVKVKNDLIEKIEKRELLGIYTDIFLNECNHKEITRDHIWPVTLEGTSNKENIILLSKQSNNLKNDKTSKIKIADIEFSVLLLPVPKTNTNNYKNGVISLKVDSLTKEYIEFLNYYDLIKKEVVQKDKKFLLIDNLKERERFNFSKLKALNAWKLQIKQLEENIKNIN